MAAPILPVGTTVWAVRSGGEGTVIGGDGDRVLVKFVDGSTGFLPSNRLATEPPQ